MAEESIGTARIDVVVNTATMDAGIEASKRRVSGLGAEAEAQFNKSSASAKKYADSLLRQTDMLGKTRAEQIAYNAQLRIGGELGEKIAAKALAQQAAMSKELGVTGKSAKEMQFAMRGLPAQITDITVGLASGQRPLMVLLQQGGQLKDMFGGIKPAAKALGGALLGLINPFTVSAAAAGALLLAWKQGSDEAVAYNKSIITTGNYAGVTAGQLDAMAKSIDNTTGATQHAAAAALAEVVSSGKFTSSQIEEVGRAAVAMSTLTGQATAETIRQFEQIGEKPVEAILKLNDAQHFLTQETYAQIKALEDQGRTQEAATLAMQTYSDSLQDRAKEVVNNAGLMEQAWRGITGAAKEAWDAMLDVGRPTSGQDQFDALSKKLDDLEKQRGFGTKRIFNASGEAVDIGTEIENVRKQMMKLADARVAEQKAASEKALQAKLVQDRADSDREAAQYFTNAQKRAKEYLAAQNMFNERISRAKVAGNKELAESEQRQMAVVLAGINAKYADKSTSKTANPFGAPIVDAGLDATKDSEKFVDGLKKEMAQWSRSTAAAAEYKSTLDDMLDTRQRTIDLQVASVGMGQREIDQQQALIAIDEDYNRKKAELQKRQQNTTSALERDGYQQQLDDLAKYHDKRVKMEIDGWRRADEARKSMTLGARAAILDFEDNAGNVAGQTYDAFTNAFDGMADSLANFVLKGKGNFSDLVESFIADMVKMEARILASQLLMSIFGNFNGGAGNAASVGVSNGTATAFNPWANAKGGVYDSPSLSAYSGQIVNKPTMFAFARGAGLMGEAGPEAIMPLRRGPDGRLGVQAAGAGDVQVEINITNQGQPVQAQQTGQRMDGKKLIIDMAIQAVAADMAKGGPTAQAAQQRFGLSRRGVPVGG